MLANVYHLAGTQSATLANTAWYNTNTPTWELMEGIIANGG